MPRLKNGEITSICWDCIHSVPNKEGTRGCSWSRSFEPVKGWKAKKKRFATEARKQAKLAYPETFVVLKCPQFEKGE